MKQIVLALALAGVFCASAAEDSFLYWMVGDTDGAPKLDGNTIQGPYKAKVVALEGSLETQDWVYQGTGGNYLNLYYDMSDAALVGKVVTLPGNGSNLSYFAGLGNTASGGWTYFIELYNDAGGIFAHSEALPYNEQSIAYLSTMRTPGTLWNVTAFVPAAVPEPNSALLMLIGCAALALRRRKQIAA